jgi:hypothetical protein
MNNFGDTSLLLAISWKFHLETFFLFEDCLIGSHGNTSLYLKENDRGGGFNYDIT